MTHLTEQDLEALIKRVLDTYSGLGKTSIKIPEIINQEELCKRLDVTRQTINQWTKRGKIPKIEIGGTVRYNWPEVVAQLEKKSASKSNKS